VIPSRLIGRQQGEFYQILALELIELNGLHHPPTGDEAAAQQEGIDALPARINRYHPDGWVHGQVGPPSTCLHAVLIHVRLVQQKLSHCLHHLILAVDEAEVGRIGQF
jgi:hypothetical protein